MVANDNTKYLTTADHAKAIRDELKRRYGYTGRDVAVRSHCYSMGSSIHVRIRRLDINIEAVRKIADAHESVRRDETTGEILNGGNRYVDVSYDTAD